MKEKILDALRAVVDPEIGYNIVDLGLVYGIEVEGRIAKITLTLTTPMCPVGGLILSETERIVKELGYEPKVELTFDPPWTPDRINPEIRRKMGI